MKKYTLDSLKAVNEYYDYKHGIKEVDVEKANQFVSYIVTTRNSEMPVAGDIIEYTNKHGEYFGNAHVDQNEGNEIHICENPYIPFFSYNKENRNVSTSTSGGAWNHITSKLKLIGKRYKKFNVWGHCGPCEGGAFTFLAEVNVWEYNENENDFSTKTHDKFHLYIDNEADSSSYKYLISDMRGMSKTAFKTEIEYKAWLKTFNGVERNGYGFNKDAKTVWTMKQESKCIPLEEYLKIDNAIIDSALSNGTIQECKRVYEGNKVTTYLPYQNDKIKLENIKQYMNAYK